MPNELLPETRSEMAVPLMVGDQILGVLDVQSDQAGYFAQEDINIMTALASQVAVALQNARRFEAVQSSERLIRLDHRCNPGLDFCERSPASHGFDQRGFCHVP